MERRKYNRFDMELKLEAGKEGGQSASGLVKNFSRQGLMATFDNFDFELNSSLELKIHRLALDSGVSASAEPLWKRQLENRCDVGFRFKAFPPEKKADILEYGFLKWIEEK